jgi:hypothetical protein
MIRARTHKRAMSALPPKADIGHAGLKSRLSESPDRAATIRLSSDRARAGNRTSGLPDSNARPSVNWVRCANRGIR